jgi:Arc/MetJ-type ribon-helix-helix transcriptional regulator
MTMVVSLSEAAQARADELIRSGRYTSFGDVVRDALDDADDGWIEDTKDWTPQPGDVAAVREGRVAFACGGGIPLEEAASRLRARFPGR